MLEETLSRLPIKGATKVAGNPDCVVVTGINGKIDASLIPQLGDFTLTAGNTTFDSNYAAPNTLSVLAPTNVQTAIQGLDATKLSVASLFSDIGAGNRATAFDTIKQAATSGSSGVVALATSAEVETGSDAVKAVTPATGNARYLKKSGGAISGPVTVAYSGYPSAGNSEIANLAYVQGQIAASIISEVNTQNTLWLSLSGNDSTASRGKMNRPFSTPAGAFAAATAGDTVIVFPGTYTVTSTLLKNGLSWFLYPGVVFTHSISTSGRAMFDDLGTSATATIAGYGTFSSTSSNKPIINLTALSTLSFEGKAISTSASTCVYVGQCTKLDLKLKTLSATDGYALSLSTGASNIQVDDITHNSSSAGYGIYLVDGTNLLEFKTYTSNKGGFNIATGNQTLLGRAVTTVGTSFNCTGGTTEIGIRKVVNTDSSGTSVLNMSNSAVATVLRTTLQNTGANASARAAYLANDTVLLTLRDVELLTNTATYSMGAASALTVKVYGYNNATANLQPNITPSNGIYEII